jgi:MerR family transcriptional regulator/heat shock protein HspR
MTSSLPYDEPCFVISVAARIVGVNTQTLRYYESLGLVQPHRTRGNQRVYSRRDVERVRRMRGLIDDLGINLAGVEVVMKLLDRIDEMQADLDSLQSENRRLKRILESVEDQPSR